MQHFLYENNETISFDCQVIGLFDNSLTLPSAIQANPKLMSFYQKNAKHLQKPEDFLVYQDFEGPLFMIFHLGTTANFSAPTLKQQLLKISQELRYKPYRSLVLNLPPLSSCSADEQLKLSILILESAFYQFLDFKTNTPKYALEKIYHVSKASQSCIDQAMAIQQGVRLCQDLANTPANHCRPEDLELAAKKLTKELSSIQMKSLHEKDLEKLGMHSFLSVSKGSDHPPRLLELHYQGNPKQDPIILVGKGITFDTGGINLKPSAGMFEMKYDMCGAATVLGVMKAIALLKLPIHVIGIMACAENMPSGHASLPGDVVKSMAGTTIEITNTDAEGRLVLVDAMTYAKKFNPRVMLDIATLTGAVIVALGHVYSGLMTPDDELAATLMQAGQKTLDKVWRLPLDPEYDDCLKSPVADLMNSHNARDAGSIVAAHFIQNFCHDIKWAHLDIAGSAWISGQNRQATGRPVTLLLEWIQSYHEN